MRWIGSVAVMVAMAVAGCGEGRSRAGAQLDRAPAGGVSAEATLAMAERHIALAEQRAAFGADLRGPEARAVVGRLALMLAYRDDPWWWTERSIDVAKGPLHLPEPEAETMDMAAGPRSALVMSGLMFGEREAAVELPRGVDRRRWTSDIVARGSATGAGEWQSGERPPGRAEGWQVGFERQMWWREMPETWSTRAGVMELEQAERAAGLALRRPVGENLEASFGYHRTLGDPLDPQVGMDADEESLFFQLGWRF